MMDLKNLKNSYPMLISFMETNGYSKGYIREFQFEISIILREGETKKWRSYDDVYLSYVEQDVPKFVLKTKRIIIRAIERFRTSRKNQPYILVLLHDNAPTNANATKLMNVISFFISYHNF